MYVDNSYIIFGLSISRKDQEKNKTFGQQEFARNVAMLSKIFDNCTPDGCRMTLNNQGNLAEKFIFFTREFEGKVC